MVSSDARQVDKGDAIARLGSSDYSKLNLLFVFNWDPLPNTRDVSVGVTIRMILRHIENLLVIK